MTELPKSVWEGFDGVLGAGVRCVSGKARPTVDAGHVHDTTSASLYERQKRHGDVNESVQVDVGDVTVVLYRQPVDGADHATRYAGVVDDTPEAFELATVI